MKKLVLLSDIDFPNSPQVRCGVDPDVVREYANAYEHKEKLPDPVLYQTPAGLLISDGLHRLTAIKSNKTKATVCEVRTGTVENCFAFAVQANLRHGLRRTNADKRQCVATAIALYTEQSNEKIAELAAVGHSLVAEVRKTLERNGTIFHTASRTGRDGKTRTITNKNPSQGRHDSTDKKVAGEDIYTATAKSDAAPKDGTGYPIPEPALEIWQRRFEAVQLVESIQQVRRELKKAAQEQDKLFLECNLNALDLDLDKVEARLKLAVPYAVCPSCQGKLSSKCSRDGGCGGRGMVSKHRYETGFSAELKVVRSKSIHQ